MPPEAGSEAGRWLREAAEDLHAARTLLADEGSPPRLACFLAHLAVEKGLEGLLCARGWPFPRTHDLGDLHLLLPQEVQAGLDRGDLKALNPWAIGGRYTDDLAEADAQTARSLVEAAERVLETARAAIGEVG